MLYEQGQNENKIQKSKLILLEARKDDVRSAVE
jgi:hypothetical protein